VSRRRIRTTAVLLCLAAVASTTAAHAERSVSGAAVDQRIATNDSWQDQIVYVLIPSKFFDGDPSNDIMKRRYHLPNPSYEGGYLGGDIAGIRQHMDYLKSLGVTGVLLYPVLFNDERPLLRYLATGYRVKDYHRVDPNLGSNAHFRALLADFHDTSNGGRMNVLLDLPIAMTGLEHPWMAEAAHYPWYYRPWNRDVSENIATAPMKLPYGKVDNAFGMGIVDHTKGMATGTGTYAAVRDDFVFWLVDHFDIDGFRYDSAQNAYASFWQRLLEEFRARYGETKPSFVQLAEAFVPPPKKSWQVWPDEFMDANVHNSVGPIGMDGVYDFGLIQAIQDVFAGGKDVQTVVDSINVSALAYEHPERMVASVDNYEDPTFLSAVRGGHAHQKLYLAEAFLLTANRVPLLYSGNEYGIDYTTPGALFQPGLDDRFLRAVRRLVAIRRTTDALRRGSLTWLDRTSTILSFDRSSGGQHEIVVLNDAPAPQSIDVALGSRGIHCGEVRNLLRPHDDAIRLHDPGTPDEGLFVGLQPFEPKIVDCGA
jgi:cyclomaltodextrinase / maltogenic alpha-amylase / neopullulanase